MTIIFDADDVAYFDEVYGRRGTASRLEHREIEYRDETRSRSHDCHANAVRWASEVPGVVPVHGWLIEAEDDWQLRIVAHTVVADEAGRLIDVTPLTILSLRFLVHQGSTADFFRRLPRCNQVSWPVPDSMSMMSGGLDNGAADPFGI